MAVGGTASRDLMGMNAAADGEDGERATPGEEGEDDEGLGGDDAGEEGDGGAQRDERVPKQLFEYQTVSNLNNNFEKS